MLDRAGQLFYEDHLQVITDLVNNRKELRNKLLRKYFQSQPKLNKEIIDRLNFIQGYLNLRRWLQNESDLKKDIRQIRSSENLNLQPFRVKEYHTHIEYLSNLKDELETFYGVLLKKAIENAVTDKRLAEGSRDLLYRHLKRDYLQNYIRLCTRFRDIEY